MTLLSLVAAVRSRLAAGVREVMRRSLLHFWFLAAFSCGILVANALPHFFFFLSASCVAAAATSICSKRKLPFLSDASLLLLFFALGGLAFTASISHRPYATGRTQDYTLRVTSLPIAQKTRNTLYAEVTSHAHGAPVRARVMDYTRSLEYLVTYRAQGKLTSSRRGRSDLFTFWLASSSVPVPQKARFTDRINRHLTYRLLDIFDRNLDERSGRFLASVVAGRRELLPKTEADLFRDAGVSHLLAISGSNVGLLAAVIFFILRFFGLRFRPSLVVALIALCVYTVFTGSNPPVVRATIMYLVFAAGFFARRNVHPLNSLGLAGLVSLVVNPGWLFDVGFQLSFLSMIALIVCFMVFEVRPAANALVSYVKYVFFSSLFVTVFITPVISYHFGRLYLLTVVYNIVLIPVFTLLLLIAFVLVAFSWVPFAASSLGAALTLVVSCFYGLSDFLGSIRFSFVPCACGMFQACCYYLLLAGMLVFFEVQRRNRGSRLWAGLH